jgi:cysteine desulfurase/selenocysteine lyase
VLQVNLDDFPLARRVTYLNSASISLMPKPASARMMEFQGQIAGGGTVDFDEDAEIQVLEDARKESASLLGANNDEIAILSSATQGICSVALALNMKAGSNIVSADADYPSVVYPWMRLALDKNLEIRLAKNRDGIVDEHELESLVDGNTAAVSISHVEYGTGQRFDLHWLADLVHSHGGLLVVDATQSAGLMPIDVHRDEVDALVAAGYKGLLGPFGIAIFYIKRELNDQLTPPLAGWRSTPNPWNFDATKMDFAKEAKKFEYSTMDYAAAVGLAESLRYLRKLGRDNVTKHVTSLTESLVRKVTQDPTTGNTLVLTPKEEKSRASIAAFRFKGRDQAAIAAGLTKHNVVVSHRFDGIRFSFHAYNTEHDISTAVETLRQLLGN